MLERHPNKKYFIDVCCGGGSLSMYVLENSNLKVIANDLDTGVYDFFKKIVEESHYEYLFDNRVYQWVSKEDYKRLSETYKNEKWLSFILSNIFSFGNRVETYAYCNEKSLLKKQLHYMLIDNIDVGGYDYASEWFKNILPDNVKAIDYKKNMSKRMLFMSSFKSFIKRYYELEHLGELEHIQQLRGLQHLESLERVQALEPKLKKEKSFEIKNLDAIDFLNSIPKNILANAIIYIDPPYDNTQKYRIGRDTTLNEKLVEWSLQHADLVPVYISSYKQLDGMSVSFNAIKQQTLDFKSRQNKIEQLNYNGCKDVNELLCDLLGVWNESSQ